MWYVVFSRLPLSLQIENIQRIYLPICNIFVRNWTKWRTNYYCPNVSTYEGLDCKLGETFTSKLFYSADTLTMNTMALFSLYFHFFFTYFNIFSELANHSCESMQRLRLFSSLFSKWCHDFKQRRRRFSKFFPIFYQSRLFPFFIIAGYFNIKTGPEESNDRVNRFRHVRSTATLMFSHHWGYK